MTCTYSTFEAAKNAIPEFCKEEKEQDAFIYHVEYQFGNEFVLLTDDQIMSYSSPTIKYRYFLPIDHHFNDGGYKRSAVKTANAAARLWEWRLKMSPGSITLEPHNKTVKGNEKFSHYTLKT